MCHNTLCIFCFSDHKVRNIFQKKENRNMYNKPHFDQDAENVMLRCETEIQLLVDNSCGQISFHVRKCNEQKNSVL